VATEGVLRFRNCGGRQLPWSLNASHRALSVQPADGSLPPGATAEVAVRLDWSAFSVGAFAARLRVLPCSVGVPGFTGGTLGRPRFTAGRWDARASLGGRPRFTGGTVGRRDAQAAPGV